MPEVQHILGEASDVDHLGRQEEVEGGGKCLLIWWELSQIPRSALRLRAGESVREQPSTRSPATSWRAELLAEI